MTNTPVADVKSYFTNATSKTGDALGKKPTENDSFTKIMNETAGKSVDSKSSDAGVKQVQTRVDKPGRKDLDNQDTNAVKESAKPADGKEVSEKITGKAEEIKDAIKEELGVTDEEIEKAMETLGISLQQLLNPDNVKELMLSLSGTEDSLSLLTNAELYDGIKQVMQLAEEAGTELQNQFALTDEQFQTLLNGKELTIDAEAGLLNPADLETASENSPAVDKHAPDVKVEVTRTEETRTMAPEAEAIAEPKQEVKGMVLSSASENAADNQAQEHGNETMAQMTQTVAGNTVGDVVETVKQFAQSYVNGEELVQQVTEYLKVHVGADTTSMEMQLHPASLGTINMQISAQNGVITAQLLVQNEAVKTALETQLVQLQETFAEQGQKVEAVEVSVANYDLDRGLNQNNGESSEKQEARTRFARRRINLNDLGADGLDELNEEEQMAASVMDMNGNSVDFTA